ncbi:MAG: molybdopterin converting factor subunit 1 [Dehalococcoidia bacterium]|nr:molybdopterin converting factor subunit 1 [Dehalococcoidia bacterium]|tara:strand:- start:3663 stop:3908 length:246 start_codon:yes stop_codon:yes gene_type:complete
MNIEVTFFAIYRERIGKNKHTVHLPEKANVANLVSAIRTEFPLIAPPSVNIVVAVNAEYAEETDMLHEGDDVCLIPPVSGG